MIREMGFHKLFLCHKSWIFKGFKAFFKIKVRLKSNNGGEHKDVADFPRYLPYLNIFKKYINIY